MRDIRKSAHHEVHEDDDSESGSTSSASWSDDQPRHEDITIEINDDENMDSEPQQALEAMFNPRPYQIEMLEESMRRNIIVAMDTGTGKTHTAILRTIEELKNSPADKLVWFLAPTIDLCIQQHALFEAEIPAVQTRLLQGNDGVKKWEDQCLWDAVLKNVRVVVSTYKILLDALANDFVKLERISLLIFDEAQNCVKKHAGVQIMRDFYQHRKIQGLSVPHILGLSASPITKLKEQTPEKIEDILDAICRTPKRCLADLLLHVNMPEFKEILYTEMACDSGTSALSNLQEIYVKYNINEDPFIVYLQTEDTPRSQRRLDICLMNHKTWCTKQVKDIYNTSQEILQELGRWAVDYYIAEVIKRTRNTVNVVDIYVEDRQNYNERRHLCNLFASIEATQTPFEISPGASTISDKVVKFIDALSRDGPLCGIVFVKQRATVAVLRRLLSLHPATRSSLRVGTVVGSSRDSEQSANISDLFSFQSPGSSLDSEFPDQALTLEKFRSGELDLILTTTVLEEGIDVPACNLVICFDEPSNLKSFVQRRGRARMKESKLILMQKNESNKLAQWQELELEMKKIYADEMRELREKKKKEDLEQHDGREYRVGNKKDGALLNLDNAVARLEHFCSRLPAIQHVDRHPEYIFAENAPAKVILPLCVDAAVRVAWGRKTWLSERNAKKDAAFEAYMALYKAGLVNDKLMPLLKTDPLRGNLNGVVEKRPSMVKANILINPWIDIARAWMGKSSIEVLRKAQVTIREACGEILSTVEILLPVDIPFVPTFRLYWNATAELLVDIVPANPENLSKEGEIQQAQDVTRAILNTAFGWRFRIEESDFCAPFMPKPEAWETASDFDVNDSQTWKPCLGMGLIRDRHEKGQPYIFEEYIDHKPCNSLVKDLYKEYNDVEESVHHLAVTRLSRRADFLHKVVSGSQESSKRFSHILPATRCIVDDIPFRIVQFALLMPSILHRLEVFMIGHRLCCTVLADVKFNDLSLVVTALSASSALEETNYQRFEFLGDSLLKMCTSMQLLAEYPLWHEGYLTAKRDQVISNSRLSRAALQAGLDKFIITKSFTGRKWRPSYVQDLVEIDINDARRDISTKVLADVVEALFGAAEVDGGLPKALACMRVFLPEINWQSLEDRRAAVFERALPDEVLPSPLKPLEKLIGYSFNKKVLLIEAMTHASCNSGVASLERLEFLGDAVLDSIIVNAISGHEVELSHVEMHHLRTAFVNADFLAFMCMEWAVEQEVGGVAEDQTTHTFHTTTTSVPLALWKFMLRASHVLGRVQLEASKRHRALRDEINSAFASGSHYPWALLARLSAPKFCSDVVESLLGAVYIDSGSMNACEGIAERMGILPYLRRVIQDGVHTLHPKEELGILADVKKVKYVVELEKKIIKSVESRAYTCEVFVGKMSVALVRDGISGDEAKTKAAEAAVRVLKQMGASGTGTVLQQEENIGSRRRDEHDLT